MKTRFFLLALLSTGLFANVNAQDLRPEQGTQPTYQLVDANLIKVTEPTGNFYFTRDDRNALTFSRSNEPRQVHWPCGLPMNGEIALFRRNTDVTTATL